MRYVPSSICDFKSLIPSIFHSGQSCIAAKRFIIEAPVYDEFRSRLVARFKDMVVGDPTDPKTQVGPMARHDLLDQLHHQVTESVKQGARLDVGGHRIGQVGCFYAPTVLSGFVSLCSPNRQRTHFHSPFIPVQMSRKAWSLLVKKRSGLLLL